MSDIKSDTLWIDDKTGERINIQAVREDSVSGFSLNTALDVVVLSFEELRSRFREASYREYLDALEDF